MKKIIGFIAAHKIITTVILIIVIGGGYFSYQKLNQKGEEVSYTTTVVERGMLISSISGTGQVSASNQVDIKPKASGDIVSVNIKNGQEVKEGDLIAQIDSRDAARKVSEAQDSLEAAELDLEELLTPADESDLRQAENNLVNAQENLEKLKLSQENELIKAQNDLEKLKSDQKNEYQDALNTKQKTEDNLDKAYEDTFNDISNAFLDLPTVVTGANDVLYGSEIAKSEITYLDYQNNITVLTNSTATDDRDELKNFIDSAEEDYEEARVNYDNNFDNYKDTSRYSETDVIEDLLTETIETVKSLAEAIKSATNLFDYWVDYRSENELRVYSQVTECQSDLSSYTSKINSHLSSLLSTQRTIEDNKEAKVDAELDLEEMESNQPIELAQEERDLEEMELNQPIELAQAERNIAELEDKLSDLKAGASELEIKNKQISIQQKQNSLIDAQQSYADYFVRVPFDGTVVEVNVAKGDSASSSTVIATLITNQKISEITLNEIDAVQVKVGQKATLTFDAVSDLSITGELVEIDTLGAVTSGVVSYDVKVAFDVQDERVKPGMSVSVNIIVESKSNVLLVPINSVKTAGIESYVEVLIDEIPQRKSVSIGSSSDTMIEIVEGLTDGEEIITQTISNGNDSTTQTQSSGKDRGPSMGGMMMMR